MKKLTIIISLFVLAALVTPVSAQTLTGEIILLPGPDPVEFEISTRAWEWLSNNRPADTNIYTITHVTYKPNKIFVSIAGLRPEVDPHNWTLDGDCIWWERPLILYPDGTAEWMVLPGEQPEAKLNRARLMVAAIVPIIANFLPEHEPGGGPMILFPFSGRAMFGPRGVHGAGDYGFVGGYAVDWVGGDDLGANVMSSSILASADGTVVGVCYDDTSGAIRVNNGITNDTFVYAHLTLDSDYEIGDSIFKGGAIGRLVYGDFDDTCGWASQAANHYHVHWMFDPEDGFFQAGKWVLDLTAACWKSGAEQVCVNGWMDSANAGSLGSDDGAIATLGGDHIWDGMLVGLYNFMDATIGMFSTREMGEGGSQVLTVTVNTITFSIRMLNLIVFGAYSLAVWLIVIGVVLTLEGVRWLVAIWRTIMKVIPFVS